ncbi:hypothetical protein [Paraburkholderia phenazinium]|jgi:hypothetical protein|uniref:Uncharacterized protein n=1 Tax=Paraburkholderia phenazinium TaxID=60549 RepID=A0A1G7PNN6_9BURK|nr:hypothetical protein [Paraburkholderia phenazinium]SDF87873.1 hypothetical protein SAMN05216466_101385 [Paraburkholderia phenazinium]
MLYLKNTLGGLSRSLHDSAVQSFQGPNRWWKLALYVVMFVIPGGSLGVLLLAWIEHRRNGRKAKRGSVASAVPVVALLANTGAGKILAPGAATAPGLPTACHARADAPACRAAAGKQARQASADLRA